MKKILFYMLLLLTALLTACVEKSDGDSNEQKTAQGGEDVQKIIVGTGTQFPNICFIDEKGNLTGYDVELVRAIDEKLPEYEFDLKTMEFSNLLLSLETRKIDFIAHQMEVNSEREEKFLFNKEPYNVFPLKVTVNEKSNKAQQKVVGDALLNSKVYFLLNKDEVKLQERLDEAIVELKKEGVISKLSKKWLGDDYTVDF